VGILEKTLQQLKAHEWGAQDNASALAEALSMDRGQQVLETPQRQQVARDILQQQLQMVQMLEDIMSEQYILYHLRDSNEFEDLQQALQLSPQQLEQLAAARVGWDEEWAALQTLKSSLTAMQENAWLPINSCRFCTRIKSPNSSCGRITTVNRLMNWMVSMHRMECLRVPSFPLVWTVIRKAWSMRTNERKM
jgi:hypothetical protein